jgi:hypothetical protein
MRSTIILGRSLRARKTQETTLGLLYRLVIGFWAGAEGRVGAG